MSNVATNTSKSTEQQRRRGRASAPGYILTTPRGHQLLVRRPDGRPMRTRPSGRLATPGRVESGQSYLHVPAA